MKYIDSILVLMREPPSDIGEPQEEFCDRIAEIFDDPDGRYEVLDRNLSDDPFEPDIEVMDSDEWAFNILCYYVEDTPSDGIVEIFPRTFGMRKWVQDDSDRPSFLALGVGGTPDHPEYLYFARFFRFTDVHFILDEGRDMLINWMRPEFFDRVIRDDFERIFSPR